MPLHTVEYPITISLGSGARQSLPPLNLLRPSIRADRADDLRLVTRFIEFRSLDIDGYAKNEVAKLANEYIQLASQLYETYLEKHSCYMKATAEHLTVLAVMSLFFATIQIIMVFIRFTAGNITSIPAPASAAFNFFAFSALTLNVLGAVFALASVRTLRETVIKANNVCAAKINISVIIWDTLDEVWELYQVPGSGKDLAFLELPKLETTCRGIKDDLERLAHIMEHHLEANYAVWTVITTGIVFFLVSLFIFMIATQHGVVMWVPTVVLVTPMLIWLLREELHRNPSFWEEMPFFTSGRLITRRDRCYNCYNMSVHLDGAASV